MLSAILPASSFATPFESLGFDAGRGGRRWEDRNRPLSRRVLASAKDPKGPEAASAVVVCGDRRARRRDERDAVRRGGTTAGSGRLRRRHLGDGSSGRIERPRQFPGPMRAPAPAMNGGYIRSYRLARRCAGRRVDWALQVAEASPRRCVVPHSRPLSPCRLRSGWPFRRRRRGVAHEDARRPVV